MAVQKSPRTSSIVQIIFVVFFFGPLRSVRIFRVSKSVRLRSSSKQSFLKHDPGEACVFDVDFLVYFFFFEIAVYISGYRCRSIKGH